VPVIQLPLRGILIPAEPTSAIREATINVPQPSDNYSLISNAIREIIGAEYFEIVRTQLLDELRGPDYDPHLHVVMLVDEDGVSHRKPINFRAWKFYPSPQYAIYGDAFLIAENHSHPYEGYELHTLHPHITTQSLSRHLD
jgi:hypothetical protein